MSDQMYGVVLWADKAVNKAVIWCEDHGNLAFYNATEATLHDDVAIDAGDLIQFDLREERECRHARNLRRVDVGFAPDLAGRLRSAGLAAEGDAQQGGQVIPFRPKR